MTPSEDPSSGQLADTSSHVKLSKCKMRNRLAAGNRAITLLWSIEADKLSTGASMARLRTKGSCTSGRGKRASTVPADTAPAKVGSQAQDTFYHDLVWSMRNGVLAIRRDGRVAVINGEAYRILGLKPEATDIGRPYTDVLGPCHDVAQILSTAFKLNYLPNRAELRLKMTGKVIGYTLSLIRDGNKRTTAGVALFFKDLTRVEQLEERERLRDRLAALDEMAAAIAPEVKNPLAGIQVMAGILKHQVPDSADAQGILNDIISEAQTANLIVLEILEFVRPIRLELDRVSLNDVLRDSLTMAESQVARDAIGVSIELANNVPTSTVITSSFGGSSRTC